MYALLGWLYSKVNSTKGEVRILALEQAHKHFLKYLEVTRNYSLHNHSLAKFRSEQDNDTGIASGVSSIVSQAQFDKNMVNAAQGRNEKIRRYKEQKELDAQLEMMNKQAQQSAANLDDEFVRKMHLTYVKSWINKSLDELQMADGTY